MRLFGFTLQILGGAILLLGGAAGSFLSWYSAVLTGDLGYLTAAQLFHHVFFVYTLPWLAPVSIGGMIFFLGRRLRPNRLPEESFGDIPDLDG